MALTIMASAGSFAAISTLLGSPILGAFLIMEAAGIGGMTLSLVALPGLLASGIGALVFIGLDNWTGLGSFSLALTSVPPAVDPTVATMSWALAVGAVGALLGWLIRWIGLSLRPVVHLNRVLVTAGLGLLIGLTAMAYQLISDNSFTQVLFSGQDALPELVEHAADYSVGVLILLAACKTLVYGLSLSAFRGGPVFPAMFIGAVLGIAAGRAARDESGARDRHGHRSHVRRDAAAALDLHAVGHPAAGHRRHIGDTAGRGRRGGGLRDHQPAAGSGPEGTGAAPGVTPDTRPPAAARFRISVAGRARSRSTAPRPTHHGQQPLTQRPRPVLRMPNGRIRKPNSRQSPGAPSPNA